MKRRNFFGILVAAAVAPFLKFKAEQGAIFKVVKIDPDGSGMDLDGHLGRLVTNAAHCCKNCRCVYGKIDGNYEMLFVPGELEPMNRAAKVIHEEIERRLDRRNRARFFFAT